MPRDSDRPATGAVGSEPVTEEGRGVERQTVVSIGLALAAAVVGVVGGRMWALSGVEPRLDALSAKVASHESAVGELSRSDYDLAMFAKALDRQVAQALAASRKPPEPPSTLSVRKLEVVDSRGRPRIELGLTNGEPMIILYSPTKRPVAAMLGAEGGPAISLLGKDGRRRVELLAADEGLLLLGGSHGKTMIGGPVFGLSVSSNGGRVLWKAP